MDITSIWYLLFVGVSLIVYWNIPYKCQWWVLLIDSLLFYFLNASPLTFVYVLISSLSAYFIGILLENQKYTNQKKIILLAGVVINVGILIVLKYTNMFIGTVNWLFRSDIGTVSIVPALAVSYYTLQIVAYMVDCYLGSVKPEKNYLKVLLFTSFFPQMVSGPISKWKDLGVRLYEEHRFEYNRVAMGMRRVLWGLAKKLVVADGLAIPVGYMFDNPDSYKGIWTLIAAIMFVVELYFDFSGCMDIVIGVSNCFGIKLAENFNAPFMSKTVQEFWQRWHITLGGWLRDYVMYPISRSKLFKKWNKSCKKRFGKKGAQIPYYVAMFVVWTLMGIWHGNSWKYVIGEGWFFWVIIVGSQLSANFFTCIKKGIRLNDQSKIWKGIQIFRTTILFAIGNIAFRADSLEMTIRMFKNIVSPSSIIEPLTALKENVLGDMGGIIVLAAIAFLGVIQIAIDVMNYNGRNIDSKLLSRVPLAIRWIMYFAITFIIILCRQTGNAMFVYFQF